MRRFLKGVLVVVVIILLILLARCGINVEQELPNKCAVEAPFTCDATLGESIAFTLINRGTPITDVGLTVGGDCFAQELLPSMKTGESHAFNVCSSQVLDQRVSVTFTVHYKENDIEQEREGVIRLTRI